MLEEYQDELITPFVPEHTGGPLNHDELKHISKSLLVHKKNLSVPGPQQKQPTSLLEPSSSKQNLQLLKPQSSNLPPRPL